MNRQPAFTPGDPVMLRISEEPWFVSAIFVGYESDPFDPDRLVYLVKTAGQEEAIVPPLFVHRDGPEFRDWLAAALALHATETALKAETDSFGRERDVVSDGSRQPSRTVREAMPTYPSYVAARDALKPIAARLFALHPQQF